MKKPFTIVIRGGAGTESTLFGLQMLYGIALSLNEKEHLPIFPKSISPTFLTSCHNPMDINKVVVDTYISSCILALTKKHIQKSYKESNLKTVTDIFFNTDKIVCTSYSTNQVPQLPIKDIKTQPDLLIAESVMYYHNRTGALHYRTSNNIADITNLVYWRAFDSLEEYFSLPNVNDILYRLFHTQILNLRVKKLPYVKIEDITLELAKQEKTELLALEIDNTKGYSYQQTGRLIETMKELATISLLIVDDETPIPANKSDILIDLYNKSQNGYILHYLNLTHNSHQDSVLGEHQYKKRDFGIEVFPSIHTYFKKKKNFHRSLLYTHSSIIEDTFPQYLSRKQQLEQDDATYDDFITNREKYTLENLESLHPSDNVKLLSYDILKKIFFSSKIGIHQRKNSNFYMNESGLVTAVIGNGNTFKRYLTIGSAFSSAASNEDTLIIILNKEKHLIQKRMACPARMQHNCYKPHCVECYKHFHFMSIYPEYITRDEFIYMFNQRVIQPYDKEAHRKVKRVIIDDLQILDYSFPLLDGGDGDFLAAIMNICRDNNISLYILCDKNAKSRDCLKALADNVVCTEKTENGLPQIYVERCSGYYNPPSKMYCGIITRIEELFECNEKFISEKESKFELTISPVHIEDRTIPNIDEFWQK